MNTQTLPKFFINCEGTWESHRSYAYPQSKKFTQLTSYMNMELIDEKVVIRWSSQLDHNNKLVPEGNKYMEIRFDGQHLKSSRGYFTPKKVLKEILKLTPSSLHTKTEYDGSTYFEEIEFLNAECRTRRTTGFDKYGKVLLAGSYVELKINV